MSFYTPVIEKIIGKTVFCFMDEGLEDVLMRTHKDFCNHIEKIIQVANTIMHAEYYITFLWKDGNDIMTDVRAHDQVEKWGSGPLIDVRVFRNYAIENSIGVGSGNTIRILGEVEQWRLTCKKDKMNFFVELPVIEQELLLGEDFVI